MIPAGTGERGERKQTVEEVSKADQTMSKAAVPVIWLATSHSVTSPFEVPQKSGGFRGTLGRS
jgi:hypothetical protein